MREKLVCRRCEFLNHRSFLGKGGNRRAFAIPGSAPRYAPDLPFRLEHILLDVEIDPEGKRLTGTVTQKVKTVSPGQDSIVLDQIGLSIEETRIGGKPCTFEIDGQKLRLRFPEGRSPKPGESFEFAVKYHAENPQRGLYFTGPDKDYPAKPHQVWSQGQDEDSRYWFPTFDYPNQKATSEVIATVPKGYTAVSNGALVAKKEEGAKSRFHYKLGTPHVTYLITLAVAKFSAWEDKGPRGLPVQYFVAPGREEDGKRAFGNTPKMIEAFEKKIGVEYPYEKYSQVAVQDFIFGGMENTSATTQTDLTLHDERAHLDSSSDPLVSHELAHQWFGDLLTCRDWSHGWLNEGFATFLERVWIECKTGPEKDGGIDEAKYYSYMDLKEYLDEDSSSYRRPIVCNTYVEPIDLFDTHLYQKGGLVLNLVRSILGEDLFWKSIQLYVSRHRGQNVETLDLIRAIEDTTGRNLRRVFDEWVFSAGFPEFEISYNWLDDKKLAELVIEQKQTGGQPSVTREGATTPLFHVPVILELTLEGGKLISKRIELGEARERVFLACPSKPVMVRFDPGSSIPKTMKFPRPKELLLYQLAHDTDCMGRIEATGELVKMADAEVVAALARAVKSDAFWGVQLEAADALAKIRTDAARDGLIAALGVGNPKARRGVVKALSSFRDRIASDALKKLATKDESYLVEGDAGHGAATARYLASGLTPKDLDEAEKGLLAQLQKSSYRETIRSATFSALAKMPGIGRGERPAALEALIEWSRRGKPQDARTPAITALGQVAATADRDVRSRILELFSQLADEEGFRTRMALVRAIRASEAPEAWAILSRIRDVDTDGRVKRHALLAIDDLTTAGSTPESVSNLKDALGKLEEEHRKLKGLVEELKGAQLPRG